MAKPTTYATPICLILTLIAFAGAFLGMYYHSALIAVGALLPTVIYEIYRTEGKSTKIFSWAMLLLLLAELALIIFKINYNLAEFMHQSSAYVGGARVPLGDIKVVGPILLAAISLILLIRTYGIYTKWLSVIIIVSCFVIVYILSPDSFSDLLRSAIQRALWYF